LTHIYVLVIIIALGFIARLIALRNSDHNQYDSNHVDPNNYSLNRDIHIRFNYKLILDVSKDEKWKSFASTYYTALECLELARNSNAGMHWQNHFNIIQEQLQKSEGSLCGEIWTIDWDSNTITSTIGYDQEEVTIIRKDEFFEVYANILQIQNDFHQFCKTPKISFLKQIQAFNFPICLGVCLAVDPFSAKLLYKSLQIPDPLNQIESGKLEWFKNMNTPTFSNAMNFEYFLDEHNYSRLKKVLSIASECGVDRKWSGSIASIKRYAIDLWLLEDHEVFPFFNI